MRILVINPGSTSTAIAFFEDGKLLDKETIRHSSEKLSKCIKIFDQHRFREERIIKKDEKVELLYRVMAYQVAQEIATMAVIFEGKVDAIFITGNGAKNKGALGNAFVDWIKERVNFIASITVYPGTDEMKALALGAIRVLKGEEKALEYK